MITQPREQVLHVTSASGLDVDLVLFVFWLGPVRLSGDYYFFYF